MIRFGKWILVSISLMAAASWCQPTEAKPNLGKKLLGAALQGETAKVQALLGQGADPNYADKEGCTPLIVAAGGCSFAADVDARGHVALTPTASRGTVEMVRALLGAGAKPDVGNPRGVTALMYAAQYGRTESVRALLDAHADLNLQDSSGFTALHLAAKKQTEIVRLLVHAGAAPDARTQAQVTALGLAADGGNLEAVRTLLGAGADAKGSEGRHKQTWLMIAAFGGHVEIMNALVDAGADVMAQDADGNTALANAAYTGQRAAVAWLLEHGAEVNARSKGGKTALSVARERGHTDVGALLEAKGGVE
jgi:ankyrin repeat protein